jgi:hypothetical protein
VPTILHPVGDRSPSLTGTVTVDDGSDLTGSTAKFQMRLETSATLKVDAAAVVTSAGVGSLTARYDWAAGDVDTAGDYIGWFLATLPSGKTQRSPQFSIQMVAFASVVLSSNALVGLRETKDWLEENNVDTSDDLMITRLINAVSDEVIRFTGREFKVSGTNPQTRTFDVDRVAQRYGYVNVGDMTSFTSVQTIDTDWATVLETVPTASIQALPLVRATGDPIRALRVNFTLGSLTWRGGYQVKVTGNFGFPSVPEDVRHAVMDTIAYRRDRDVEHPRDTLSAVPGVNDAGAAVVLAAQPRILAFPPDVYATLIKYRAPVVG